MEPKTYHQYIQLAHGWLYRTFADNRITASAVKQELLNQAQHSRANYWRRLRRGLSLYLTKRGYPQLADELAQLQNPVKTENRKPRQQRCKKVTPAEHERLIEDCYERDDRELWAALTIARLLGVRPAEMSSIKIRYQDGDREMAIFITSAKKREGNDGQSDRALDRLIYLPADYAGDLPIAVETLRDFDEKAMKAIQNRLKYRTRVLWPSRKVHPNLYSYRHTMGSDLKASDKGRPESAAIMGHLNQDSISRYGNARQGGSGLHPHLPVADPKSVAQVSTKPPKRPPRRSARKKPVSPTLERSLTME